MAKTVDAVAAPPAADETAEPDGDRSDHRSCLEQARTRRQCIGLLRGTAGSLPSHARGTPSGSRHRCRPRRRDRIPHGLLCSRTSLPSDGLSTLVSDWLAALAARRGVDRRRRLAHARPSWLARDTSPAGGGGEHSARGRRRPRQSSNRPVTMPHRPYATRSASSHPCSRWR